MNLDKSKPYGEIHGHCPVDSARYEQNGHYFNAEGERINPRNLSLATLDLMEPEDVREMVETTFPDERIDKRFGKERLIQWVRDRELASAN